jgi:hypothetical protein
MAVLDNSDYNTLRDRLYSAGQGKTELKALVSLPNETKLRAGFQAIEDFWTDNQLTLKAALDTALGFTTTNALAKKFLLAWLIWRFFKG